MKNLFTTLILISCLVISGFAQNKPSESSDSLNQKIVVLFQKGEFDEAITLGKKVVENEKKAAKDSETHAIALMNLAILHKERLKFLQNRQKTVRGEDAQKTREKITEDAENTEKLLRETLKIYDNLAKPLEYAASLVKTELAWILNNYFPSEGLKTTRARIDEAERLYTEILAVQEKTVGNEDAATLKTVLASGDFYMKWVNFEKALPFYERYLAATEKKYGANHKAVVPALRAYAEIYVISQRPEEAEKNIRRIAAITGKTETLPTTDPNMVIRSRGIANVDVKEFIPIDLSNNASKTYSYGAGAGAFSQMGKAKINRMSVSVLVDESGNVIEAKADGDPKYIKAVETAALKSKFRPFIYNGIAYKIRGSYIYSYFEK